MKPVPMSAQEKSIGNYKGVGFSRVNPSESHGPCHWVLQFRSKDLPEFAHLYPGAQGHFPGVTCQWINMDPLWLFLLWPIAEKSFSGRHHASRGLLLLLHLFLWHFTSQWDQDEVRQHLEYMNIWAEPQWRIWTFILEEGLLGMYL